MEETSILIKRDLKFDYDIFIKLISIFIIFKSLDIFTTIIGIKYFGLIELNPLGLRNVLIISLLTILLMIYFIQLFQNGNLKFNSLLTYNIAKYSMIIFILIMITIVTINTIMILITIW